MFVLKLREGYQRRRPAFSIAEFGILPGKAAMKSGILD